MLFRSPKDEVLSDKEKQFLIVVERGDLASTRSFLELAEVCDIGICEWDMLRLFNHVLMILSRHSGGLPLQRQLPRCSRSLCITHRHRI